MQNLQIKWNEVKWSCYSDNKIIASSKCRSCVVKIIIKLTKNSTKYNELSVYDKDGSLKATYRLGEANDRNNQEISK